MPNHRRIRLSLALGLFVSSLPPPAVAGDGIVNNAGFDVDLAGWSNPFGRPAAWDLLDALGAPDSGSARVGNDQPGNNATSLVLGQCVPVESGQAHSFSALGRVLPGQPAFVLVRLGAFAHAGADCSDTPVSMTFDDQFSAEADWRLIGGEVPAEPTVQAIALWLGVTKPGGVNEPVFVQFDDVRLVADAIFASGFEP